MTPEELRLECLKLALQSANASGLLLESSQIISRARAYSDFVINWNRHGGVDNANGAPVPEAKPKDGLRRYPPSSPQFESSAEDGRPRGAG